MLRTTDKFLPVDLLNRRNACPTSVISTGYYHAGWGIITRRGQGIDILGELGLDITLSAPIL